MNDVIAKVVELHSQLGLTPVGDDGTAYGTIGDSPLTMIVLGLEPLALLFVINVNRPAGVLPLPSDFAAITSPDTCQVVVEKERAWLSLYNLGSASSNQIIALVERFHEILIAEGFAVSAGCLRCKSLEDAKLIYFEKRTTRICSKCLAAAETAKKEIEAKLNASSTSAKLGLPLVVLIAAIGWTLAWLGVDGAFRLLGVEEIELNRLTFTILIFVYAAIGIVIGGPLGMTLRKSGAVRVAPVPLACLFSFCVVALGEFIYVVLLLLWHAGIFDLALAFRILGHVVASYSGFWIASKLMCFVVVCVSCSTSAKDKTTVILNV